jgi:uncharacterized protein (DUF2062 family)
MVMIFPVIGTFIVLVLVLAIWLEAKLARSAIASKSL